MQILCVAFQLVKLSMWVGVEIYFMIHEHLQLATLKGEEGEKSEQWKQGVP